MFIMSFFKLYVLWQSSLLRNILCSFHLKDGGRQKGRAHWSQSTKAPWPREKLKKTDK